MLCAKHTKIGRGGKRALPACVQNLISVVSFYFLKLYLHFSPTLFQHAFEEDFVMNKFIYKGESLTSPSETLHIYKISVYTLILYYLYTGE